MKMRKITSLIAALTLVLMLFTSTILFIAPQGRVAYWADWHLLGLTKTDWSNIHINLGILFLISLFLHIYYNWKPLINYLKDKARTFKVFTPEFNVALIVTIVFTFGTYIMVPPFSWVMSLNENFQDSAAVKYGEPPYGHAELSSLKTFAKKMNLDLTRSVELLNEAGYPVEDSMVTLQSIGKLYNISSKMIYNTIKPTSIVSDQKSGQDITLPESPPPGTGNLTLADFCTNYSLNMKHVVRELKKQNIIVSEDMTLKEISTNKRIGPVDLYELIKAIANPV